MKIYTPDEAVMKIYTPDEYAKKMDAWLKAHPEEALEMRIDRIDSEPSQYGFVGRIIGVERKEVDGKPALVIYVEEGGDKFGITMDRRMANDLTAALGPHPLIEEFFRLH